MKPFLCVRLVALFDYDPTAFVFQVQHGEELEQLKRDMAVVLQASLGVAPSPAKDDSNVQQLKQRIKELEEETEELSRKYNEELKTERVRAFSFRSQAFTAEKLVFYIKFSGKCVENEGV